jgi:hypothetical protein
MPETYFHPRPQASADSRIQRPPRSSRTTLSWISTTTTFRTRSCGLVALPPCRWSFAYRTIPCRQTSSRTEYWQDDRTLATKEIGTLPRSDFAAPILTTRVHAGPSRTWHIDSPLYRSPLVSYPKRSAGNRSECDRIPLLASARQMRLPIACTLLCQQSIILWLPQGPARNFPFAATPISALLVARRRSARAAPEIVTILILNALPAAGPSRLFPSCRSLLEHGLGVVHYATGCSSANHQARVCLSARHMEDGVGFGRILLKHLNCLGGRQHEQFDAAAPGLLLQLLHDG